MKIATKIDKKKEHDLLNAVKKDKHEFSKLYEQYYLQILNYVQKRVNEKHQAEDIVSEIFIKAFKAIKDFQWQGVSFSSWLYRIARNSLTDYYRKNARNDRTVSIDDIKERVASPAEEIEKSAIRYEQEQLLYEVIMKFKEDEQYLIYYKFFENFSNKEIADLSGLSETNVGTKLHRIRNKMKKILERKGEKII